ncbi:hypothetical protein [Clostridium sporogenes]|uniref:hypothetical protein n=1 Tax=Clostridium sporogenes TaxID=1509 RepID=UPI003DA5FFAF
MLYQQLYEDCNPQEYRINNYYKECFGPIYACKDACYDPFTNSYRPIGPWKVCGICIGYNPFFNIQYPLCCVYWDGRSYFHKCAVGGCPIAGPNNSVLWDAYSVPSCEYCK